MDGDAVKLLMLREWIWFWRWVLGGGGEQNLVSNQQRPPISNIGWCFLVIHCKLKKKKKRENVKYLPSTLEW